MKKEEVEDVIAMENLAWRAYFGVDHEEIVDVCEFDITDMGGHKDDVGVVPALKSVEQPSKVKRGASSPIRDVVVNVDGVPIPWLDEYHHFCSYLSDVVETGKSLVPWKNVQSAFMKFLKRRINVLEKHYKFCCNNIDKAKNVSNEKIKDSEIKRIFRFVLYKFLTFENFPCTFDKICEVLVSPPYCCDDMAKFMGLLEDFVNVKDTIPSFYSPDPILNSKEEKDYGVGPMRFLRIDDKDVDRESSGNVVSNTSVNHSSTTIHNPEAKTKTRSRHRTKRKRKWRYSEVVEKRSEDVIREEENDDGYSVHPRNYNEGMMELDSDSENTFDRPKEGSKLRESSRVRQQDIDVFEEKFDKTLNIREEIENMESPIDIKDYEAEMEDDSTGSYLADISNLSEMNDEDMM
ncbi:hypothetical protein RB195_021352 [Necator americanus]